MCWFSASDSQVEEASHSGAKGTSSASKSLLVQGFNRCAIGVTASTSDNAASNENGSRSGGNSGDWIAEFSAWIRRAVKHVAAVRFYKQDLITQVTELVRGLNRSTTKKLLLYAKDEV